MLISSRLREVSKKVSIIIEETEKDKKADEGFKILLGAEKKINSLGYTISWVGSGPSGSVGVASLDSKNRKDWSELEESVYGKEDE